jgi:conjugal transfer pilus assembly protein TraE
MKTGVLVDEYNQAIQWRNRFLFVSLGLFALNIIQGVSVYSLISRKSTIVVPANFHREFSISDHSVSDSYLEQMTQYFTSLLLNVTPGTFDGNISLLLQHVLSNDYSSFKSQLTQQKQELNKKGLSTTFYISNFKVYRKSLRVKLRGELRLVVGNSPMETKSNTYQIEYVNQHGRLYIKSFKEISREEYDNA